MGAAVQHLKRHLPSHYSHPTTHFVILCPWDSSGKNTGMDCCPLPPPGDLPNPGVKPKSLTSPALAAGFFTTSTSWEAHLYHKGQQMLHNRTPTTHQRADQQHIPA